MTDSVKRYQLHQWVVAIAAILPAFALFAERQPYERYQSVVDRQMFGQPPSGFDPTKNPSEVSAKDSAKELTKEQEQVKSAIHFSVINVTPAGDTAVGFTDNSDSKSPKHYYLKVGETRDGWTVKEADALAATMTIAKGEIEVSLTLGGDSSGGNGTKKVAATSSRPEAKLLGARAEGGLSRGLGSLRERRALREQQREAAAAAAAEEKRLAAEKEAQREAERAAEKEAERAEREAERAEMQRKLKDMADAIRKQQEEASAKQEAEEKVEYDGNDGKGDAQ